MDPVQEIKSRLDIVDVVSPHVQLKKAGKYFKALCPFHQEKTASFFVNPERQIAYCFSCEKGGDMFQFIQEVEGVDFRGSLEILAEKANIELPKFGSGGPKVSKDAKDQLRSANAYAAQFFSDQLWGSEPGKKVLEYLKGRGLTEEIIRHFQLGFAPDSKDELYRHLLEKKHEKDTLLKSTLAVARDSESKKVVDRFHLRLMVPIADVQGHIIAFGGRALKKGDQPKYLNSPEYVLYDKGSTLYNLNRAKAAIREQDAVIVVEGYFDVMASHQAGLQHVVSNCGTALTEKQFKLMKRYTKRIFLAFDADSAGQAALRRAVETSQPLGLDLFVVRIPEGKDAADAVKEDPKLWEDAVAQAKPYLDFYEEELAKQHDLETATGKRSYADAMLELLKGVQHPVERDHYVKRLSKQVGTPLDMLYDYLGKMNADRRHVSRSEAPQLARKTRQDRLAEYFIGMTLAFPKAFFERWQAAENAEAFVSRASRLGLVMPLNRLDAERFKAFREDFDSFLEKLSEALPVSSVYKRLRDAYNLSGSLDENFYSDLEDAHHFQKLAFQAELKNRDPKLIQKEFEKVIALLYFESIN